MFFLECSAYHVADPRGTDQEGEDTRTKPKAKALKGVEESVVGSSRSIWFRYLRIHSTKSGNEFIARNQAVYKEKDILCRELDIYICNLVWTGLVEYW